MADTEVWQVVLVIKWHKRKSGRTVKGYIEVFALNTQGTVESLQKEVKSYIFIIDKFAS